MSANPLKTRNDIHSLLCYSTQCMNFNVLQLIAAHFFCSIRMNSQEIENLCTDWSVKRTTKMWLTMKFKSNHFETERKLHCAYNHAKCLFCWKSLCIIKRTLQSPYRFYLENELKNNKQKSRVHFFWIMHLFVQTITTRRTQFTQIH